MIRYGFNIRTKSGQRVDNILILAATLVDAERRLRQMYLQCVIIECREQAVSRRGASLVVESPRALEAAAISGHKPGTH